MTDNPNNIALFIDYENVHYGLVNQYMFKPSAAKLAELILNEVGKDGNILIKKAYADWEKQEFKGVQAALKKSGIEPAYTLSKKTSRAGKQETWKDSADAVLLLDALQTMFERTDIQEFAIVTGDRAALDLIHRLRSRGKTVRLCALESALAQELNEAVEDEVISIENLLGIEPLGTSGPPQSPDATTTDWTKVIVSLAELEGKFQFVGCSLLKTSHGFTQPMFAEGQAMGVFEIYSVSNPKNPNYPTSAVRLKRGNPRVISALSFDCGSSTSGA
jgi:uncharacterized LabA/DUF88 family protein